MVNYKTALEDWISQQARNFEHTKLRFDKNMAQNPHYALEWSMAMFEATAGYALAMELRYAMENGASAETLVQNLPGQLSMKTRLMTFSTSPTDNLIKQLDVKILGDLVEKTRWWKGE